MRFRSTATGVVVDLPEDYAKVFGDTFVPVTDDNALTAEPCCGSPDWDIDDEEAEELSPEKKK